MRRNNFALLEFNPDHNNLGKGKELRDGLSVVVQVDNILWVTNDGTISLDRLSLLPDKIEGGYKYSWHKQFLLSDFLKLPAPPLPHQEDRNNFEEADVEGLDYSGGYLWLVGSHSLVRKKPDQEDTVDKNITALAKVKREGNRFLLARIPLSDDKYTLEKKVEHGGKIRTAALLHGDASGNDLTRALADDKHLGTFLCLPGKDNGLDIEGLAVVGDHVFLGLRGPVLRGWAVILELELEQDKASTLVLKKIGQDGQLYLKKHYLQLDGLGIRDLCVHGSDLLILAGPTMDLDGPDGQGRNKGKDHAEGITLFSPGNDEFSSILVVYDSASKDRQKGTSAVEADIFPLNKSV